MTNDCAATAAAYALEARVLDATVAAGWRRRRAVLRGVSFALPQGETCALLGHNGAGKTTALRILLGLLRADAGQARLGGRPSHLPGARHGVGFLPERAYYPAALSAFELVVAHAQLAGLGRAEADVEARRCLTRVGLMAHARRRLGTYSKGMLQRAGLAQALVARPRLLVLDEPFSGLDPMGRVEVRALLQEEHARGCSVLLSTHVVADVEALCQRLVVLRHGQVQLDATPDEVRARHRSTGGLQVRCAQLTPEALAAARALASAHVRRADADAFEVADAARANRLLDVARNDGAQVLALQPRQAPLDEMLVEVLRG